MAVLHKKLSTRSVLLLICLAFSEKKFAKIREKIFLKRKNEKDLHFLAGFPVRSPGGGTLCRGDAALG